MKLTSMPFKGLFEEQNVETAEDLEVVVPENHLETDLLSWAILAHPQTVTDEESPGADIYRYHLHGYLENGLFALALEQRGPKDVIDIVTLAAALVAVINPQEPGASFRFEPFWFISEHLTYDPGEAPVALEEHRSAYGRLIFGEAGNLPQRRLFGPRAAGG